MTRPAIDAGLMLPVATQAPAHLETGRAIDPLHGDHISVADAAVNPGADMHHVREIDMVRQAVDPDPGERLLPVPVSHQFLYFRRFRGNVEVAGTAVSYRGDAGETGNRSVAVTVEAWNAV